MNVNRPSNMNPLQNSWAESVYVNWPNRAAEFASSLRAKLGGSAEKAKWWGSFAKQQLNSDFCEFARMEAGGRMKALIAEPPRLPLLLLLYPGTMGPRVYRAWQRGEENGGDHREMWDVIRRDGTAITFFVFALSAMVGTLSKWMQNASGVNLLSKGNQVLRYSQFKNYELDLDNRASAKSVLKAILAEGNAEGLEKAMGNLQFRGEHTELSEKLEALKGAVKELVKDYKDHLGRLKCPQKALAEVESHLNNLMDDGGHFAKIENLRSNIAQDAARQGNTELAKVATAFKQDLGGALVKFAKERRLPSDFLSFAIVVALIGWLPVNLNSAWNKRQFDKKQAAAAKAKVPVSTPPKVPQRPVASFNGSHLQVPYSAKPMANYAMWPQSSYPQTVNPFARYDYHPNSRASF